jgi:hypothetical protein
LRACTVGGGADLLLHQRGRQHDVLADRQVREQVEALEDHADVLAQFAHGRRVVVQQWLAVHRQAAALEYFEPVDAAQQRALARAALADDGDDLAGPDLQVDALEHLVGAIGFAQGCDLDDR